MKKANFIKVFVVKPLCGTFSLLMCNNHRICALQKNNETRDKYPVVGDFLFKRLHRNDSFSLKCMVCNNFVTFSSCCCVIMTEFARYNEKN